MTMRWGRGGDVSLCRGEVDRRGETAIGQTIMVAAATVTMLIPDTIRYDLPEEEQEKDLIPF